MNIQVKGAIPVINDERTHANSWAYFWPATDLISLHRFRYFFNLIDFVRIVLYCILERLFLVNIMQMRVVMKNSPQITDFMGRKTTDASMSNCTDDSQRCEFAKSASDFTHVHMHTCLRQWRLGK